MSDTSLVFNLIARDSGLGRVLGTVADRFRSAGRDAEHALEQAGNGTERLDGQIAEVQAHLRGLNEEFVRTGDTTLFGKMSRDRSLISQLQRVRKELDDVGDGAGRADTAGTGLSGMFARASGAMAGFGGQLSGMVGGLSSAVSSVWSLSTLLAAVAAAGPAAGAGIAAFGGMAAALPGMVSGAIAAIATLKLGLFGLGENWKAMNTPGGGGGGGGSSPVQDLTPKLRAVEAAQRQVARSARDITDAQDALKEATDGVNEARQQERERIEDVRRSLASARADEAESVQSLAEARMQLSLAEARGNPDEIRRAQIAVDKQAASLAEAKDKTQDLQQEADEAARKGVEGSDAVVDARKRESAAQRRVQDAVEQHKLAIQQLGDAQKALKAKMDAAGGSAGGLAAQIPKISRSAREFLDVLRSLQPAFEDLRLEVQERLFSGLGDKLRTLANVWIPQLKISLGDMASTINGVVKTAFDSLSNPSFVSNMAAAFDGFRGALGEVGQAIAGPLVDAWGRLARASVPFMDMLGDKIAGIITHFSDWIARMDESGQLQAFMAKATTITGHVLDIFEDLARIAGSVISILFGTSLGSTDAWENLADGVDRVADFMADPENQAGIRTFLDTLGGGLFMVMAVARDADAWINRIRGWAGIVRSAATALATFFTNLPAVVGAFFTWAGDRLAAFPGQVQSWLGALPTVVWQVFTSAMSTMAYVVGAGIRQVGVYLVNLLVRVWNWLRPLPRYVGQLVGNAIAWFRSFGPSAYNAARNVGSYLWAALNNLPSLMRNAGYNAALGIWNGITSLAGWLWSKVYNLGVSMWSAFMRGIGARSPSRKFAEAGRWAVLGAVQGLEDNSGTLMAAAQNLAAGLAGTRLALPGIDTGALNGQLTAAATSTVTVAAARRRPVEVVTVLDVRGTDSQMKTLIRSMARTGNLNQDRG
jgi:hypothetical protein